MTDEPRRWLVCYDAKSGMAQLNNVGIVVARTRAEAVEKGKQAMRTTANPMVFILDQLSDGWCYWT